MCNRFAQLPVCQDRRVTRENELSQRRRGDAKGPQQLGPKGGFGASGIALAARVTL